MSTPPGEGIAQVEDPVTPIFDEITDEDHS